MAHHSELAQFISAAIVALDRSFADGDYAKYNRNWEDQSETIHWRHERDHLELGILEESDLDHAIFRLLAIKVLRLRQQMDNK